ncbi:hypothetical protein HYV72_00840 [Candidatus Uhrbacteria bacterium]|nr:hypothetical protein [Candidatus Uhrbacteria bacterium]
MGVVFLEDVSEAMRDRRSVKRWLNRLPVTPMLRDHVRRQPVVVRTWVRRAVLQMMDDHANLLNLDLLKAIDTARLANKAPRVVLYVLAETQATMAPQFTMGGGTNIFSRLCHIWRGLGVMAVQAISADRDTRARENATALSEVALDLAARIIFDVLEADRDTAQKNLGTHRR